MAHIPVMLTEVLEALQPADGEVYVDGTFGAGGYTAAVLERADCKVIAIDRDKQAIARANVMQARYGERLIVVHGCFGDMEELLHSAGFARVDGIMLDIGVSSMQIDEVARGFSFRTDGPLDMRMDTSSGQTAADIVNTTLEGDLADLIYLYGEERHSRRIARRIVERRAASRIETTGALADIVRGCVPKGRDKIDPATRTFQALRIAVNDELGELERGLAAADRIVQPGGRAVIVSFHSLEDRIVKNHFRGDSEGVSRHSPAKPDTVKIWEPVTRKALTPTEQENRENPRARSARLRAYCRTGEAA